MCYYRVLGYCCAFVCGIIVVMCYLRVTLVLCSWYYVIIVLLLFYYGGDVLRVCY